MVEDIPDNKFGWANTGTTLGRQAHRSSNVGPKQPSYLWPLLLTWYNMAWDEIDYPFLNFNGATVEV